MWIIFEMSNTARFPKRVLLSCSVHMRRATIQVPWMCILRSYIFGKYKYVTLQCVHMRWVTNQVPLDVYLTFLHIRQVWIILTRTVTQLDGVYCWVQFCCTETSTPLRITATETCPPVKRWVQVDGWIVFVRYANQVSFMHRTSVRRAYECG